jgi:hypothetical protein
VGEMESGFEEYVQLISSYSNNIDAHMTPFLQAQLEHAKSGGDSHALACSDAIIAYFACTLATYLREASVGKRVKILAKMNEECFEDE